MRVLKISIKRAALLVAGLALAGCNGVDGFGTQAPADAQALAGTTGLAEMARKGNVPDPRDEKARAKEEFRNRSFGLAETRFRRVVEMAPRDAEAWLGLAASYDELRRFDLADRSYAEALRLLGPSVAVFNNRGYSYLMRGNLSRARNDFAAAQRIEPTNSFVMNNLRLLDESQNAK